MSTKPKFQTMVFDSRNAPASGPKIIRQNRYESADLDCKLKLDDMIFPVLNYSTLGIAILSPNAFPDIFNSSSAEFEIDGYKVASFSLRKVRQESFPGGGFKVAFEIQSEPMSIERLSIFPEICRAVRALHEDNRIINFIPPAFSAKVFELKEMLIDFEKRISTVQATRAPTSSSHVEDLEETVIEVAASALYALWQQYQEALVKILANQTEEVKKAAYLFFRKQLQPLLHHSPFAQRSLGKPLGYTSDFEMLNLIYQNETMGASLFARCLERCFLDHPEPRAVFHRVGYLLNQIKTLSTESTHPKLKVLSLVSGPAIEIQKLLLSCSQTELDRYSIELLDQDDIALRHAQWEVRKLEFHQKKRLDMSLIQSSLMPLIESGLVKNTYDLIYSAGLFDSLPTPIARRLIGVLFQAMKPGGKLVVGNFDVSTPNHFGMSMIFDWNITYRSQSELEQLFRVPGTTLNIEHEAHSINLFCVLQKSKN